MSPPAGFFDGGAALSLSEPSTAARVRKAMLDLLGVWDLPEMRPFRARMLGHPITRPERTVGPVPLRLQLPSARGSGNVGL